MAFTPEKFNSGTATVAASGTLTVSINGTTDADDTVIVGVMTKTSTGVFGAATGLSLLSGTSGLQTKMWAFKRAAINGLVAGESSWSIPNSSATVGGPVIWVAFTLPDADPDVPVDVTKSGNGTVGTGAITISAGNTPTATYESCAVSFFHSFNDVNTTPDTWTSSIPELFDGGMVSGTGAISLGVFAETFYDIRQYAPTATASRNASTTGANAGVYFVFTSRTASKVSTINILYGAESGATSSLAGNINADVTVTGNVTVDSVAALSGNFGYRLVGASSISNMLFTTYLGGSSVSFFVWGARFRFPTLPAADVELVNQVYGGHTLSITFIAATSKLRLSYGGNNQVSDSVITANTPFLLNWRANTSYLNANTVDWGIDYGSGMVIQTQVTPASNNTSAPTNCVYKLGPSVAGTYEIHADDLVGTSVGSAFPLGDIRILPLKVDPAGTPTVSGTATNFGVMTANGTIGAWNATNARNAIDDVPPNTGAARDALIAVTGHATDYVEIPMDTYDLNANGVTLRGVKVYIPMWAASATAATMRLSALISGSTYNILVESDPNADNTAMVWVNVAPSPTVGRFIWTQAMLDSLAIRFGALDATPDIGIDSIIVEIAVKPVNTVVLQRLGSDDAVVSVDQDTESGGYANLRFAVSASRGATFNYEYPSGTVNTVSRVAGDPEFKVAINAVNILAVPRVTTVLT
jgi:hypothetical protein